MQVLWQGKVGLLFGDEQTVDFADAGGGGGSKRRARTTVR